MQKRKLIPTKSFKGPASLPGVDFSDHRNYWKYGYSAVMITNTAFYRNQNYHKPTDQIKTLDLKRLALTVDELYLTVLQLGMKSKSISEHKTFPGGAESNYKIQ